MQIELREGSNASSQSLISANFPSHKEWAGEMRIVLKLFEIAACNLQSWVSDSQSLCFDVISLSMQFFMEDVKAEKAHFGNSNTLFAVGVMLMPSSVGVSIMVRKEVLTCHYWGKISFRKFLGLSSFWHFTQLYSENKIGNRKNTGQSTDYTRWDFGILPATTSKWHLPISLLLENTGGKKLHDFKRGSATLRNFKFLFNGFHGLSGLFLSLVLLLYFVYKIIMIRVLRNLMSGNKNWNSLWKLSKVSSQFG